jgi:hypothetical protein
MQPQTTRGEALPDTHVLPLMVKFTMQKLEPPLRAAAPVVASTPTLVR